MENQENVPKRPMSRAAKRSMKTQCEPQRSPMPQTPQQMPRKRRRTETVTESGPGMDTSTTPPPLVAEASTSSLASSAKGNGLRSNSQTQTPKNSREVDVKPSCSHDVPAQTTDESGTDTEDDDESVEEMDSTHNEAISYIEEVVIPADSTASTKDRANNNYISNRVNINKLYKIIGVPKTKK